MTNTKIFPLPKKINQLEGTILRPKTVCIEGLTEANERMNEILAFYKIKIAKTGFKISFKESKGKKGEYVLLVDDTISISYADLDGLFSSLATLKQLFKEQEIPKQEIKDYPNFPNRGILLDISRNRVYKKETIFKLIDLYSDIKINQLQLYIEGRSFYYENLKEFYENKNSFLTPKDVLAIDEYAMKHGIALIPCQNSFGHMTYWLNQKKFNHLAESPNGFSHLWLVNCPPGTLNPSLEESESFVKALYDNFIPYFKSDIVNVCGDEPFELGINASKNLVKKRGKEAVYLDFMNKLFDHLKGKRIMMWGDVVKNNLSIISSLPSNLTLLEWGYGEDAFNEEELNSYSEAKLDYYVCPGTRMWGSITGFGDIMKKNIKRAAKLGHKCKASGLLLTDWGDGGSWQQLSFAYYPYLLGAAYSWNLVDQDDLATDYLNEFIFHPGCKLAEFIYSLSNSYKLERGNDENATKLFKLLYLQQTDNMIFDNNYSDPLAVIKDSNRLPANIYSDYIRFFEGKILEYEEIKKGFKDPLLDMEIRFSLKILLFSAYLGFWETSLYDQNKAEFEKSTLLLDEAIDCFKKVWNKRNKPSDFKLSIARMELLQRKCLAILS